VEKILLNAEMRPESGTAVARRLRSEGKIPAVVYAKGEGTLHITADRREFVKLLHKQGENVIISLNIKKGSKMQPKTVIIKEIQYDTIKEDIFHVDFQQIKLTEKIRVHVPLVTRGDADALGVKEGGILEHVLREVEVECLPTDIPKQIVIDVANLNIGDSVHVRELAVDEKVTLLTEPEQVAVLVKFKAEEKPEEEKVEEETAEPEVISEKKPEESHEDEEKK